MTQARARVGMEYIRRAAGFAASPILNPRDCASSTGPPRPMDNTLHRPRRLAIVALACAGACSPPTAPFPEGAVRFRPNDFMYRRWWAQLEACTGRRGSYDAVRWYRAPGDTAFRIPGRPGVYSGAWYSRGNRIVLVQQALDWPAGVRHEMLHAVLRVGDHPREFFRERCGTLVNCADGACSDRSGPG